MGPSDRNQIFLKTTHSSFSVDLQPSFLKIDIWKLWKHVCELCHFEFGNLYSCHHEQSWHERQKCQVLSQANVFLLFFGKERTNMAAPWGASIWGQKKFLCSICLDRTTTLQSLPVEMFVQFLLFSGQLGPLLHVLTQAHSFSPPSYVVLVSLASSNYNEAPFEPKAVSDNKVQPQNAQMQPPGRLALLSLMPTVFCWQDRTCWCAMVVAPMAEMDMFYHLQENHIPNGYSMFAHMLCNFQETFTRCRWQVYAYTVLNARRSHPQ